jgi:hypothetical protein
LDLLKANKKTLKKRKSVDLDPYKNPPDRFSVALGSKTGLRQAQSDSLD